MKSFSIATHLTAPPEAVWQHVTTVEGINGELRPLMRMTVPRHLEGATLEDIPIGERLGRSWILLFGFIPVDFDELTIAERGPGHRFFERSKMLTQSLWTHERIVEPVAGGSRIVDHLSWRGRFPPLGLMYRIMVPRLFRHRHRQLRRRFGGIG